MAKTSSALAQAACDYATRGWAVLPCRGKVPITPHGFKNATLDLAQIRLWWGQWPDANIGIATGTVSGLVVLDIDPRHGGEESLAALIAAHEPLPETTKGS